MQELPFMVLKELLAAGADFHKDVKAANLEGEDGKVHGTTSK